MAQRTLYKIVGLGIAVAIVVSCAPEKTSNSDQKRAARGVESSEEDQEPVAIINGELLTLGEFDRRVQGLAPFARVRFNTVERKQEYLNSQVQFEVMAGEAQERGYDKDPAVRHAIKEVMVRAMLNDVLRERVSLRDIDDEMIEAAYQGHLDAYRQPERRRVLSLIVDTEDEAQRLRDTFERGDYPDDEARLTAFRVLAHRHSIHRPSAERGGDIGFVEPSDNADPHHEQSAKAVFEIQDLATVSRPHATDRGWQIAMILETRPARLRPLEDVARDIRTRLYEERRQVARDAFIAELVAAAKIETFPDVVKDVQAPGTTTTDAKLPRRFEELPRLPLRDLKAQ